MLVNKYKCSNCFYEVFSELLLNEEKVFCPVCGKQGVLEMDNRDWNVELVKTNQEKKA